jgi:hypothetical protein
MVPFLDNTYLLFKSSKGPYALRATALAARTLFWFPLCLLKHPGHLVG